MDGLVVRSINFGVVTAHAGTRLEHYIGMKLEEAEKANARATLRTKSDVVKVSGVLPQEGGIVVKILVEGTRSSKENILVEVETCDRVIGLKGIVVVVPEVGQTVTIYSPTHGRVTALVPLEVELWKSVRYKAVLDPPMKEFSLTEGKGIVKGGAKVAPFDVIFMPGSRTKSIETKLTLRLEDTGEIEWTITGVCGAGKPGHGATHVSEG
jgi:hypothetical protein